MRNVAIGVWHTWAPGHLGRALRQGQDRAKAQREGELGAGGQGHSCGHKVPGDEARLV